MTVADLLTASRQHALQRKRLAGRANKDGHITHRPNYPAAEQAAAQALKLRLQAHDLDPDHTDPAWSDDPAPHAEIVAFLEAYASIP